MKPAVISIIIIATIVLGSVLFANNDNKTEERQTGGKRTNVGIVDGKQIITIKAKGGYTPWLTLAQADTPTVLKIQTRGTFDCSSSINIPRIGYQKNLPPSGETEIEISPQKPGTSLQGLCGMGMYNFQIAFN